MSDPSRKLLCRKKLIREVKKFPVLYDVTNEQHKEAESRERAWRHIADTLQENSEFLKREWKILRDSLRQAVRKQKKGGRKWAFEDEMSFVKPFMTKRPSYPFPDSGERARYLSKDSFFEVEQEPIEEMEAQEKPSSLEDDGLDLFFASVSQCTRMLPRKLQQQVKSEVLKVLHKAEDDATLLDDKNGFFR